MFRFLPHSHVSFLCVDLYIILFSRFSLILCNFNAVASCVHTQHQRTHTQTFHSFISFPSIEIRQHSIAQCACVYTCIACTDTVTLLYRHLCLCVYYSFLFSCLFSVSVCVLNIGTVTFVWSHNQNHRQQAWLLHKLRWLMLLLYLPWLPAFDFILISVFQLSSSSLCCVTFSTETEI